MKNYLKSILYVFSIILISLLVLTILNYFDIVSGKLFNTIKFIIPLIGLFIGGVTIGKHSEKKGWLNGLQMGLLLIFIFIILCLIFNLGIDLKNLIYYLILLGCSTFGSMIGINKKDIE